MQSCLNPQLQNPWIRRADYVPSTHSYTSTEDHLPNRHSPRPSGYHSEENRVSALTDSHPGGRRPTKANKYTVDEGVECKGKEIHLEKQLRATQRRAFLYTTEIQHVFKGTIVFPHPLIYDASN